jgi:hypothetical protein
VAEGVRVYSPKPPGKKKLFQWFEVGFGMGVPDGAEKVPGRCCGRRFTVQGSAARAGDRAERASSARQPQCAAKKEGDPAENADTGHPERREPQHLSETRPHQW